MKNLEMRRFFVLKIWANKKLREQRCYVFDEIKTLSQLSKHGLQDAKTLYKIMLREVCIYNGNIDRKIRMLEKLEYRNFKTFKSKVFSGLNLPFKNVDILIRKNPTLSDYDIYMLLKESV